MQKGRVIKRLRLFEDECLFLLKNALERVEAETQVDPSSLHANSSAAVLPNRFVDSSEDEDSSHASGVALSSDSEDNSSSSLSQEDSAKPESQPAIYATIENNVTTTGNKTETRPSHKPAQRGMKSKCSMDEKASIALIQRHVEKLRQIEMKLLERLDAVLQVPYGLLTKEDKRHNSPLGVARFLWKLANDLGPEKMPVVVLFLRSGRFAGAVFQQNVCVRHTTSQRYTIRKGQGKAQSAQDGQRRAKSIGAQLRRAGEQQLKEDVTRILSDWKDFIRLSALILVSCPRTMQSCIFSDTLLSKNDERIRRVSLDLGRPTFENAALIHATILTATLREAIAENDAESLSGALMQTQQILANKDVSQVQDSLTGEQEPDTPLSDLHVAAQSGDIESLQVLLETPLSEQVDKLAGTLLMTPLHLAAEASEVVDTQAAECVYLLLTKGKADPCAVDVRHRVPYFLASSDKVRDAFRRARADLGEECWDWEVAKVGPPLTEQDVHARREKEAEKKRRKRARQKEKKVKEKAEEDALEKKRLEEEEKRSQDEAATRIRHGLKPKATTATNVCDFCQKLCVGKRRSQMFQRLDYVYCSSECVQKHKRELMATAALSRMGT